MKPTSIAFSFLLLLSLSATDASAGLQVGAAAVDITPTQFPVLVNGGMLSRSADTVTTRLHARSLVLDDGHERLGIVLVDCCMMARPFLDEVKQLASQQVKIQPDRMLIAATHTHTAPSNMGALGTEPDENYIPFLRERIVQALVAAEANLEPARIGWAVGNAADFTALRRWIRRPDRVAEDPFGNLTMRANMHAARNPDDVTGESGPEDPDLSLIAFQATDGRPLAVLANFSMHYFSGERGISADYFGLFCEGLKTRIAPKTDGKHPPFVGIMSHGCSGDIWRRDYAKPIPPKDQAPTITSYTDGLLKIAIKAYQSIQYSDADLAMAEARVHLKYRVPDKQRLEWAQKIVDAMGNRPPKTTTEVYAREQIFLNEWQSTDVVVQAVRIGDIGIATTSNETYALTGLKLKRQSPLAHTLVIELANGGDGYIPPPEQHLLGGYNTWPARSAGLEVQAEPKIVETALELLEKVAKQPRRRYTQSRGPAVEATLKEGPVAYWRLDEFGGSRAADLTDRHCDAFYEPGVVFFLDGPRSDLLCSNGETNRAAHFAGGRLRARVAQLPKSYSVALWFWNGMPAKARDTAGWLFSRGYDAGLSPHADHLGIGGTATEPGKLIFLHGDASNNAKLSIGRTVLERWRWYHVVFVRNGDRVQVYLDGDSKPEIDTASRAEFPSDFDQLFFGGRCDNDSNWEGRLDEIAVFDRALSSKASLTSTAR